MFTVPKMSHPTWVRGLKHHHKENHVNKKASHPTWVRGLKQMDS